MTSPVAARPEPAETRHRERLVFLFLAVIMWPILAVAVVGGFGFAVWMVQIVAGPPGS